jgi:hypothetical protein
MKVKYQIAMIGDKYLVAEMADGMYYFLFDAKKEELELHPPQLLTDEQTTEFYGYEFGFIDEITSNEYSSLDIIFRQVEIEI